MANKPKAILMRLPWRQCTPESKTVRNNATCCLLRQPETISPKTFGGVFIDDELIVPKVKVVFIYPNGFKIFVDKFVGLF